MSGINFLYFLTTLVFILMPPALSKEAESLRMHLSKEPLSLDPTSFSANSTSYLLQALTRPLLNGNGEPEPALKGCQLKQSALTCKINSVRWSDGTLLRGEQIFYGLSRFIDPDTSWNRFDLVQGIRNAREIKEKKRALKDLRKSILWDDKSQTLTILLEQEAEKVDGDFMLKLSSYFISPLYSENIPLPKKAQAQAFLGPYQIHSWDKEIVLKPNPYFDKDAELRPWIKIYFIPDDTMAVQLYIKGQLDYLRRVPAAFFSDLKDLGLRLSPVSRIDYIGFGPELKNEPLIREALTLSLPYKDWQELLQSKGRPGCWAMPNEWLHASAQNLCYPENLKRAKELIEKRKQDKAPLPKLAILYSQLGGEDHKNSFAFLQSAWQKNLGVKIELRALENKSYLDAMENSPSSLYRRGLALDYSSCSQLLALFSSRFKGPLLHLTLNFTNHYTLYQNGTHAEKIKICSEVLKKSFNEFWMIPTGSIHFASAMNAKFTGLELSPYNQLDFINLRRVTKDSP